LDEIGNLSLHHQAKILTFLEDKSFTPVGGKNQKVDVRIIAATNKKLIDEVSSKRFRNDLYYRLSQFNITTEPLSNRPEDVICLVNHFEKVKNIKDDKKSRFLSKIKFLLYSAPETRGNVRGLETLVLNDLDRAIQEFRGVLEELENKTRPPQLPWKIGQLSKNIEELNTDDIVKAERKFNKYKEQQLHWRKIENKTKALETALYFVKQGRPLKGDPEIDFEKCVNAYEIITLFQQTKLSKAEIANKLNIRKEKLSPSTFTERFGFDFPDRNDPYNVLSPIDTYPTPKKSNHDEDYKD
jgi:transcriptional regulator with PAS, ATPase and Fis domain